MALTKLPKNAFGTDSVDDSKIEDGTIQNQELAGSLSEDRLATGTIENASLSNSSITINGTSISLGGSSSVGVDVNWQSVQTTGFTAVAGNGYFVDTTSGAITVTLPASASLGDQIAIKDYAGTFASNSLTIGRNGHNIQGVANDSEVSTNRASLVLVYVDSTKGWIYAEESNVADLQGPLFTSATGGTVTESGDYKIHTFTGDGCFVVNTLGNGPTYSGGPSTVSYLVIAGGGGGGGHPASNGGGGGAGGFREGRDIGPSYTASPLVAPSGLTISSTTYPVTVGSGGVTGFNATSGSDSIFSTITSTGGGAGGSGYCSVASETGGSGGGGSGGSCTSGASGNTPPVTPPQGNNGGNGSGGNGYAGGGGGGAGTAGSNTGPDVFGTPGAPGGNGVSTSITGSSVTRAGGGGGFTYSFCASIGSGGSGGGGDGGRGGNSPAPQDLAAGDGTVNTGSGGGGRAIASAGLGGGNGGKGIVVIRYKFQ